MHGQVGRQAEHLQGPLGINPHQQQGIGVGCPTGSGLVERIPGTLAVEADHQQGDAAARGLGQVGWRQLLQRFCGTVAYGPEHTDQTRAHGHAYGYRTQPQQGGSPAGLAWGGTSGHGGLSASHFGPSLYALHPIGCGGADAMGKSADGCKCSP